METGATKRRARLLLCTVVLSACIGILYERILSPAGEGAGFEGEFPEKIGDWNAERVVYDPEGAGQLPADRIIYKSYRDARKGPPIVLFMACYESIEKADSSHSPVVCSEGQGWQIVRFTRREIPVNLPDTPEIEVNQMIHTKLDSTLITVFWYQSADRAFRNRAVQKLSLFLCELSGRGRKNAFVRLTSTVPSGGSIDEGAAQMAEFVQRLYPELRRFLL